MTSADRLRYGLRPRLATLTAMRPPGSSLRTHSANTSREQVEVLQVRRRHAVALELLLVLLAGEVRRRRDDERHRAIGDGVHRAGRRRRRTARRRAGPAPTASSVGQLRRAEALVEARWRRGSRGPRRRSSTSPSAAAPGWAGATRRGGSARSPDRTSDGRYGERLTSDDSSSKGVPCEQSPHRHGAPLHRSPPRHARHRSRNRRRRQRLVGRRRLGERAADERRRRRNGVRRFGVG